ncbi:YajQ family cyclic di-GMP-binding protein [Hymenobacter sp. CRA2]|uniref:YajQ family cyclic di-GMP-binding protein n=1 Tax=Hymenobacter sp. CRA2 TaxID=1955620 RepID=UPI00098F666F|nr:YajQ family cyclic di-GMP-binding protein [Hymenobacter sp. CRA2]OON66760.1 YajQ family cyclic di-GMP-binding protein [Hymenobacter sp. CRA2]
MASFDIVSKVDPQTLENAVNNAKKELMTRYDFRDTKGGFELDKANNVITLSSENSMKLKSLEDILMTRMVKQSIDPTSLDFSAEEEPSGALVKKKLKVRAGIDKDLSRKVQKLIKDSKLKVEAQIQGDQLRVTAKKIDELQAVIALLRTNAASIGQPLQFVNMKS